ncbi:MAG: hypothetical protein NTV29_15300 [Planctomycetota bacterium]|nr:hypothetical protein [Planctomycetota bacterium]
MNRIPRFDWRRCNGLFLRSAVLGFAVLVLLGLSPTCTAQSKAIEGPSKAREASSDPTQSVPEILKPWIPWVLWDERISESPSTYRNAGERIDYWPSQVEIQAEDRNGSWKVPVDVFRESWFPLPGGLEHWPQKVTDGNQELVVVERGASAAVKLKPGKYVLQGLWEWNQMPQKIAVPQSYGWVRLQVRNEPVPNPNWDNAGQLWLNRATVGEIQKDNYSFEVYRLLQDGSPIWLRTQIDLTATGKSREEELGFVLPEGWQLSFVNSPIPVAIDEMGKLKVQVRAGNWKILIDAFRTEDLRELKYSAQTPPAQPIELLALQGAPNLRTVELQGVLPIDAATTQFPANWRNLTVYQWKTDSPASWVQKNQGMGIEKPNQLDIQRTLWLDDDGRGMTYVDLLVGEPKQITRLDVAKEHQLGVVRIQGERQLITQNPTNGSEGVELRIRRPTIEAVGRATNVASIPATGWQTPAEHLSVTLYLPPGWRMFALFGPDRVEGDWLTSWTLLDLFLLLVFSLAVLRLYGWIPGLIAFAGFALTYHEPGSPRWTWFFLLIPLALIRVIGPERNIKVLHWWKNIAAGVLLLNLIPFAATQIQNGIYPQLEPNNVNMPYRTLFQWMDQTSNARVDRIGESQLLQTNAPALNQIPMPQASNQAIGQQSQVTNMLFDPKTSIQTGVAKPQWLGNSVVCVWDGPVSDTQSIRPVLISCNVHRLMTIARLMLMILLLGMLLGGTVGPWPKRRLGRPDKSLNSSPDLEPELGQVPQGIARTLLLALFATLACSPLQFASAQVPDQPMLDELRERVKRGSDALEHAAEIPEMRLKVIENRLEVQATVHAIRPVAVPLPGKSPTWFPSRIQIDDQDAVVVRRDDGHLWVLVPEGIHRLTAEGRIVESTEWSWGFILAPRKLSIEATDWTWSGLQSDGKPESQVIFVRKEQLKEGQATYDQKNFRSVFLVERRFEIGLVWKVYTQVRRLSRPGKAVSISVPALDKEQIITPGVTVQNGNVEVNFGAEQMDWEWQSELPIMPSITLASKPANNLVEKWLVETSPVWSMSSEGSTPIFDISKPNLVPEWNPWPGDSVVLNFQRPSAVAGKSLTIQSLSHQMEVGSRQRKSRLSFEIESSLGGEQAIPLPAGATVTEMLVGQRSVPIRRQGDQVLFNLQPGSQEVRIEWTDENPIHSLIALPAIEMPDEVANIRSQMSIPTSRWILWANGPQRGPAVRFWVVLTLSLLVAWVLGNRSDSPLKTWEWMLLAIGLTQVHIAASLLVVAWLFSISFRRKLQPSSLKAWEFNFLQVANGILTAVAIGALVWVVTAGLLGSPRMFIVGNESFEGNLNWFTPRSDKKLPEPWVLSVSIWYYRLLMLVWALWLANSLLHWLKEWYQSLTTGGGWKERPARVPVAKSDRAFRRSVTPSDLSSQSGELHP